MENKFQNSIKNKLTRNMSEHGNIALELQKSKKKLIKSIKNYKENFDKLNAIEDPSFDDLMEETDSWGELFSNILYYDEIKREMSLKTDIEMMLSVVKLKIGAKND